jgi:hypothetical protein
MASKPKTLSAGLACDKCGFWPMPDPFYAVQEGLLIKYICTECATKLAPAKPE